MACVDQFNIPIKIGDYLLVYGVNTITNCKVIAMAEDNQTVYVDCVNHGFNPNKCVVITEQVKANLKSYPEYYYYY